MLRLQGLKKPVQALAFAPDGRTLASAGNDAMIRLWELPAGREIRHWAGHTHAILALAFAPDGKTLASGSGDRTVKVWDVPAGEGEVVLPAGGQAVVTSLAFSPDGGMLAASHGDRQAVVSTGGVRWWDTAAWRVRGAIASLEEGSPWEDSGWEDASDEVVYEVAYGGIQSVAFAPDGRALALATAQSGVVLWNVRTTGARMVFPQNGCRALAIAPDGRLIAAADANAVHLWDMVWGTRRGTLEGPAGVVWSVAFSPDGKLVLSGARDGTVRLWDAESGKPRGAFDWDVGKIHQVAFAPDGMTAAVAGESGTVVVWDVDPDETGAAGAAKGARVSTAPPRVRKGSGWLRLRHGKAVERVAFSPDGKLLASLAYRDAVRLWERDTGTERCALPKKTPRRTDSILEHTSGGRAITLRSKFRGTGRALAFAPDGRTLALSCWYNVAADVWDLSGEEVCAEFRPRTFSDNWQDSPLGPVIALTFSPDGGQLFLATDAPPREGAASLAVRYGKVGHLRGLLLQAPGGLLDFALSGDGRTLACATGERKIVLWDVAKHRERTTSFELHGKCLALACSPDGATLAGAVGRTVRLWDTRTGAVRLALQGHTGEVRAVAFAPDGSTVLSGGQDGTVRLWDAASGTERAVHDWKLGRVRSVAFAPDGAAAAAGGDGGEVILWELSGH